MTLRDLYNRRPQECEYDTQEDYDNALAAWENEVYLKEQEVDENYHIKYHEI